MARVDEGKTGDRLPAAHAVHVWRVNLRAAAARLAAHTAVLSADERYRAEGMASPHLAARFASARGALREILGSYLGIPPARLLFVQNAFGKPALAVTGPAPDLRFNLSHSGDVMLVAIARGRDVGIDVEECLDARVSDEIAALCFSPGELEALRSLPASDRTRAFYATWTRKEAYVKARGVGLSLPLDSFTVSVGAHEPPRLLAADRAEDVARWSLISLPAGPHHEAALVVEGARCEVVFRDRPTACS